MANGSKGWDGIATSMALPEYWPAGTVYEIAFWTPNRFDAAFDPNHGGEAAVEVEQVTGTSYVLPPDPLRLGARFAGWWTAPENGARITASTQVTATRPHTFYAHWTMNRYYVHFDANGGSGTAEPVEMTVGTPAPLPPCPFAKVAHDFAGWATEPGGAVVYADGAQVADLAYAQNAAVTLYAVWRSRDWTLADYLDAPALSFGTAGGGEWGPDWDDAKAGGAAVVSTGRSDYPNQVNNVLCFPAIFRGALDVRASDINDAMKLAAAHAIAGLVSDEELSSDYILPKAFDPRVKVQSSSCAPAPSTAHSTRTQPESPATREISAPSTANVA